MEQVTMKLVEAKDAFVGRMPRGEYARIAQEFAQSDMDCAEVKDIHIDLATAYRCFVLNIKKIGLPIHATKSGDRLFLIKGER